MLLYYLSVADQWLQQNVTRVESQLVGVTTTQWLDLLQRKGIILYNLCHSIIC